MERKRKTITRALAVVCAGAMLLGVVNVNTGNLAGSGSAAASGETVTQVAGGIDTHTADYFDSSKVYRLTDTVTASTDISVILSIDGDTVLDMYDESGTDMTFSEYSATPAAMKARNAVAREENSLVKKLNSSGVNYTMGMTYDTLIDGFEVIIKAGDYSALAKAVPEGVTLIVGEEYEKCDAQVVTNDVNVDGTGIFDSSESKYNGDGTVVAVLDTGLDYTHSAFSVDNFHAENLVYDKSDIDGLVSGLNAANTTSDLTASDVYINEKVPYQYDYADGDADVFPINSEHGTHVSGVITGNDDEITGVAPSAQLMMMKVFSDVSDGAKTSWILAALEDCVTLGVDVINMSLGSACGFSREVDNENINAVYDKVEATGISMVVAAGNDYNATYGSEKNGSLNLTSNPDSGTVGNSSTYDSVMSVASVSGVKDNYMVSDDGSIIYFNEATDSTATTRSFFDDILTRMGRSTTDTGTYVIPYEVIPGLGRNSDYEKDDYSGEIVLVKRGTTTFEEKIRIAMNHNALGVIIYNNVSGDISMSIGSNADAAACSISQDDGEMLAGAGGGYITISQTQEAGPFMSDFSSWGPTSDLKIKPEITAHGGDIYSCVPGQSYDRMSGTSMACPNMAGVTAIVRQYVKANDGNKFGLEGSVDYTSDVLATVNKLEMSTADIIYGKNGLPYSVRKQGAGLVNLYSAQKTDAYISTLDSNGEETDKTKFELGDDAERSGVYEMSFIVRNVSSTKVRYDVGAVVQTEGVSSTYTSHGDTTVSQDGETLSGAKTEITSVLGGTREGSEITVEAGKEATVTVKITLSQEDKDYLDGSFENGMYVEGFITLEQLEGTDSADFVNLNAPFLAFYGDWTEAPVFDEEYYDTNADEINSGLDESDKLMADAYATRVVGGLYDDYIAYMGTYMFTQDPSAVQVAASKDYIAMSNSSDEYSYNINSLAYVYAGLLRNVKEMDIVITEDSTGKVIYTDTVYNQRKSYGTSTVYMSAVDMNGFSAYGCNLKNNTRYTVTLSAYIDYGYDEDGNIDKARQDEVNKRNTFSFPLYIDYEAPVLTDVEFRTEYDSVTKQTSLFADLYVYDNHYAMAAQVGNITKYQGTENYLFSLDTFGNYFTPVNSSFNSTTLVSIELTDYINDIKDSAGYDISADGETYTIAENTNSFIVVLYDYALNSSIFEVRLPDSIISMYFDGDKVEDVNGRPTVTLEVNETLDLAQIINVYPSTTWVQTFDYASSNSSYVAIVDQTVLALAVTDGRAVTVTVSGYASGGGKFSEELDIIVQDTGKGYTLPVVNSFSLKGYHVNKAFYSMDSDDMEIGYEDYTYEFDGNPALTMYPSEQVTVSYNLSTYFPNATSVRFVSANSAVAEVTTDGMITAIKEGSTSVTATVYYDDPVKGETSQRSARISITVKDPYTISGNYLMSYKGLGGEVDIPDDRGITIIYEYAFSNYEYILKDLSAGDVIDDEDPYASKPWFIGDDTITKVVIPEGVKEIDGYAFANLTALEEVVLPSTLTKIGYGAFYNCTSLTTVTFSGKNNLQFVNDYAFYGCSKLEKISLTSIVAIGKYSFAYCDLDTVSLGTSCQSIGDAAFTGNTRVFSVSIQASSVKLGSWVFANCRELEKITVNAEVIPSYAFYGCSKLKEVTFGSNVSVINAGAFYGTAITSFEISSANQYLRTSEDGKLIYSKDYTVLYAVAPDVTSVTLNEKTTTIASGAFRWTNVTTVSGGKVATIKDYAFSECKNLTSVETSGLDYIGDYAFYESGIKSMPALNAGAYIGYGAFAYSSLGNEDGGNLEIEKEGLEIGEYAFYGCQSIVSVKIADGCTIGAYAFYGCSKLETVEIGEGCVIGDYAFAEDIAPDYYSWYLEYYSVYGSYPGEIYWYLYGESYGEGYDYCVVDQSGTPHSAGEILGDMMFVTSGSPVKEVFYSYSLENASDGSLTNVKIGNGTKIGTGAFMNCSKISSLTLGSSGTADIVIGDYAFYNCVSIDAESDFFENVVEVGAYAFAVTPETIDVMFPVQSGYSYPYYLEFAYDVVYENGEPTVVGYRYTTHSGPLSGELNLSSVEKIGEGAFAYNTGVTAVILNASISDISAYAFYGCSNLGKVCKGGYGDQESGDCSYLSDVTIIGAYAFAYTGITSLVLNDQVKIGEGAFYMCEYLTSAENLGFAEEIGAYAFAYTKLGTDTGVLDLSGVSYIGDYAFAYIAGGDVAISVLFLSVGSDGEYRQGEGVLEGIGENPFLGTNVDFGLTETDVYNGESVGTVEMDTYAVSGNIFVSDGVLYSVVGTEDWTGNMLITYSVGKTDKTYIVEEGTVRISAHAFDGNPYLQTVTLSSELTAIGDKAFYGCTGLAVVVFTSYYAPDLEEEFDEDYYSLVANYPGKYYTAGYYTDYGYGYCYEGLGIYDYTLWSETQNNYFYGATFVDYIGKVEDKLTMVVPVNGLYYDSFTLAQYFDTVVYGAAAATAETLTVIAMIEALPSTISLSDAKDVNAALAAYNALPLEQQALVTNYSKLTSCVGQLDFLESLQPDDDVDAAEASEDKKSSSSFMKDNMWGLIIALVILLAFVALLVYTILTRRNKRVAAETAGLESGASAADTGALEDAVNIRGVEASEGNVATDGDKPGEDDGEDGKEAE